MIIAIDFDGTIVRGKYPTIDGLMPGAKQFITQLKNDGHYIIINSCRSKNDLIEAINFLIEKEIPFNRVNDNSPILIKEHDHNSRKVFAHVYIDDRNLFGFPGWSTAYNEITRMEAEYKNSISNESN